MKKSSKEKITKTKINKIITLKNVDINMYIKFKALTVLNNSSIQETLKQMIEDYVKSYTIIQTI